VSKHREVAACLSQGNKFVDGEAWDENNATSCCHLDPSRCKRRIIAYSDQNRLADECLGCTGVECQQGRGSTSGAEYSRVYQN